jgi:hypothetical protein
VITAHSPQSFKFETAESFPLRDGLYAHGTHTDPRLVFSQTGALDSRWIRGQSKRITDMVFVCTRRLVSCLGGLRVKVLCKRGAQDIHPAKVGNDGTDNHRGMKNCSDVMVGVVSN